MSHQTDFLLRLDLEPGSDKRAVKRAYARELKKIDIEADPDGFQELRSAYEEAQAWLANQMPVAEEGPPIDPHSRVFFNIETNISDDHSDQFDTPKDRAKNIPELLIHSPESEAETVFQEFLLTLAQTPADSESISRVFLASLQDSRLGSLEAREIFEYLLARYLDQGWRPGNQHLLETVARVFSWSKDHSRLSVLGVRGTSLANALLQLEMIKGLMPAQRKSCQVLLDKVRNAAPPRLGLFQDNGAIITFLSRYAPDYLALVAPDKSIREWLASAQKKAFTLDCRVERFVCKARGTETSPWSWKRLRFPKVTFFFWILFLCFRAISFTGGSSTGTHETSPSAVASTLSPAEKIVQLSLLPADEKNCSDLSDFAHANRMGQSKPILDFDKAVEQKVGECIASGYWRFVDDPLTGRDPAVEITLRHSH